MQTEEFLQELKKYQGFFDPIMYEHLVNNAKVIPVDVRVALIDKVHESAQEMSELFNYQKTREGIRMEGLQKLEGMFEDAKAKFKDIVHQKETAETSKEKEEAERLLKNL